MVATESINTNLVSSSLVECLFSYAISNADKDAVVTTTLRLSYAHLAQLVQKQAELLYKSGISSHSIVGIKCANETQHLVMCLATIYLGATSCTIPTYEEEQIQNSIISNCGVTNVIDERDAIDLTAPFEKKTLELAEMPIAQILFSTSGTTGEPKQVVHQDRDIVTQAYRHIRSVQERFVCLASIEHNFSKRHRLYCVAEGATNIFLEDNRESLVAKCLELNINVMHLSAFQAQELLAAPDVNSLSNIRLKLGGSHVNTTLRQKLKNRVTQNLQAGYGTTETGAIAFTDPDDLEAGESVGQPLPGIEIHAVNSGGEVLAKGERGELAVRCQGMFREYLGNPDLTAARLKDNWFYTGDIGFIDKQKRIFLSGRTDEMFVFNSMNIYPQDIEAQICKFPGIADAAVLPKRSSMHGNIPIALIVIASNLKPNLPELKKFVKKRIGLRTPRQFIIVDEIPRNASGKVSRQHALSLSVKSDQIRKSIIQVLEEHAKEHIKPSIIASFLEGDADIKLRKFRLDSLARMDLLVALEVDYDTIITPQDFSKFRYLGHIVARVISAQDKIKIENDDHLLKRNTNSNQKQSSAKHYIVRLFQRIFSFCNTVAQLNKALATLEYRLTPVELELLLESFTADQLIPSSASKKYFEATSQWLQRIKSMMLDSGKKEPELFVSHRISPNAVYFKGEGSSAKKTLLICFSVAGGRSLMMPNAVLMQHSDSTRYDLLVISEPQKENYRLGVPHLGENVVEVAEWIGRQKLVKNYDKIRTIGSSAGSYPAIIAGYHLGAELAVSVGGRFHKKNRLKSFLDRTYTTWQAVHKGCCSRVLMSYATDDGRDCRYAKIIAKITHGSLVAVEFANESVGHSILQRLVERGELASYLKRTIFAEDIDGSTANKRENVVLNFPADKTQHFVGLST